MAEAKVLSGAGLRGQVAGQTALSTVGQAGAGLTYRGYDVRELAADGRISATELGRRIGLSKSPTQARMKRLEEQRVITGYRANLDPIRMGQAHVAFVEVRLSDTREAALQAFNKAVLAVPEVEQCHMIASSFDYLLKVRTKDITAYRRALDELAEAEAMLEGGLWMQLAAHANAMAARLAGERMDVTLPPLLGAGGLIHPISRTMEEMAAIFGAMGFAIAEGPDIEDDWRSVDDKGDGEVDVLFSYFLVDE